MKKYIIILAATFISTCGFGQIIEGDDGRYYADNMKPYSGTYKEFHTNGNTRIEMDLDKGVKNGSIHIYFENGILNEVRSFANGKMDGTWVTYNRQNVKIAEANYQKGKKHGDWKIWDDKGTLRCQMHYKNGNKIGTWLRWDDSGNLLEKITY